MSIKAALPPQLSGPFSGALIETLEDTVVQSEGTANSGAIRLQRKPTLIHKQDGRNYFRLTEIPKGTEMHCVSVDCANDARLILDSRDCEPLAYCVMCANVEHAMWLAGVRA